MIENKSKEVRNKISQEYIYSNSVTEDKKETIKN